MIKLFVISDERCGSTQFGRIFDIIGYKRVDDPQTVYSMNEFMTKTESFMKRFDYIKVCSVSFTNQQISKLIRIFCGAKWKIVLLWRRNYLERAISRAIAETTGVWSKRHIGDKAIWNADFAINQGTVSKELRQNKKRLSDIKQLLNDYNVNYYDVEFGELYGDKSSIEEKYNKVVQIFDYINPQIINAITLVQVDKIKERLSPSNRINGNNVYKQITNIRSIIKSLSNEDNGIIELN